MPSTSTAFIFLPTTSRSRSRRTLRLPAAQASPTPIRSPRSGEALLASPCNRSHATRAAACSAAFFERPSPAPYSSLRSEHRRRRTASSGRGPRGAPGSGAADRTAGPPAPGAASCSPARPGRSPARGYGAPSTASTSRRRRLEPAVEVHRGDDRLHRVGQDRRLGAPARRVLALAEPQRRTEVELLRDLGQRLGAHDRGAQLRQLALGHLGVVLVDVVGDDEAEHGVTEELEPLVRVLDAVLRAVRTMGQGAVEEGVIGEFPTERDLQPRIECRVDGTAPPSDHHTGRSSRPGHPTRSLLRQLRRQAVHRRSRPRHARCGGRRGPRRRC